MITFLMKERFNILYVIYCISYITYSNVDQVDFLKERFKEKKFFNNEEHKSLLKKVNNNLLTLPALSYQNTAKQKPLYYLTILAHWLLC